MNDQLKETFIITQEECAEVIQEISKIFRFGIDEMHKSGIIHRHKLEMEVGDLLCMIDLLLEQGVISQSGLDLALQQAKYRVQSMCQGVQLHNRQTPLHDLHQPVCFP
jgi:hypothetical protein